MSEVFQYKKLALEWQPKTASTDYFRWIMLAVFAAVFVIALALAFIKVPEPERRARIKVPERIANFIAQRPKVVAPPVTRPEPKPLPPPKAKPALTPEIKPKVTVQRERPSVTKRQPLTQKQIAARDVAQQTGLAAMAAEMSELTDTSAVDAQVRGRLTTATAGSATTAAGHDLSAVTGNVAVSGGVVDQNRLTAAVGGSQLQARVESDQTNAVAARETEKRAAATNKASTGGRASEDITIVIDRNKAGLQSLYERYRRKNAVLKGKVIFQITIDPSGKVINVKVLASELNEPTLEQQFASRIKMYVFAPTSGNTVTIDYPIEFLP